jgi:hypothetical protein
MRNKFPGIQRVFFTFKFGFKSLKIKSFKLILFRILKTKCRKTEKHAVFVGQKI